ncbi:MAG: tryptophan synthase subunit alpha [Cyclobacteriaceae bacterium]|nr:tryptophan synthase subunit alpha [Cyclobacteriaceae bacterium]
MVATENRLTKALAGKRDLLAVYYTAGFPALNDTVAIGESLAENGVDIIEIGIPFSDPVADGPVIQASNKVALDNGMNLRTLLEQVKALRSKIETPIVLMGYFNPVLQFGVGRFCIAAADAGVDGLIIPDLPLTEYVELYKEKFEQHGLINISLISPTTSEERIRNIDDNSSGFIYAVSASSTTGAKKEFGDEQIEYFKRLQSMKLKNPFLIGFGISNASTFKTASQHGAGAIIGSAFIAMLQSSTDLKNDIRDFIKSIKTS